MLFKKMPSLGDCRGLSGLGVLVGQRRSGWLGFRKKLIVPPPELELNPLLDLVASGWQKS